LSDALGLNVTLDHGGRGGVLHIHYRELDQLEEVLRRLEGRR
jgi:ParB family transcriptional regulator, chromosome partitioning protein